MDVLADILSVIKLRSNLYFRAEFGAPICGIRSREAAVCPISSGGPGPALDRPAFGREHLFHDRRSGSRTARQWTYFSEWSGHHCSASR